jgi:hypothetical protein
VLSITGTGDPGNTVTATAQSVSGGGGGAARFAVVPSGIQVGSTTVGASGSWTLTADLSAKLPNGKYVISITQGNGTVTSAPTARAVELRIFPPAPIITTPASGATVTPPELTVAGTAELADRITVTIGTQITGAANVAANGTWSVTLPLINVSKGDIAIAATPSYHGHVGEVGTRTIRLTPAAPTIDPLGEDGTVNESTLKVSGTGETGDQVNVAGPGGSSASALVGADGTWAAALDLSAVPNGDYNLSAVQSANGVASAPATLSFSLAVRPTAPEITTVDTAQGLYFPVVSGTGVPGGTVIVSADDGTPSDPITVNPDGTWISPQLDWTTTSVTATQTVDGLSSKRSPAQPVDIIQVPPTPSYVLTGWACVPLIGCGEGFTLTVEGANSALFSALGDDEEFEHGTLDAAGSNSRGWVWVNAGTEEHTISVRYDNGLAKTEHRYGPSSSIPFQAPGDPPASAARQSLRVAQSAGVAPAAQ